MTCQNRPKCSSLRSISSMVLNVEVYLMFVWLKKEIAQFYDVITIWQVMTVTLPFLLLLFSSYYSCSHIMPTTFSIAITIASTTIVLSLPLLQWIVVVIWIVVACNNGNSGRNKKEIESAVACPVLSSAHNER